MKSSHFIIYWSAFAVQQPEKVGWIRKFCGRGIFRELWRNRYVVLRGDHLYISDKEVKDERKAQEVFDLADYERSEELRKAKSRSKKNHSRFTVLRCRQPGNTVPNLVFLAVSPEEKESWVNAFNVAIIKAKNRVLDEVTIEEDNTLAHPTRDRAKIPHGRRLPTRGHLMAVASTSSHGMLTLDLVAEEDYDPEHSFRVELQRGGSCGQVGAVDCRVVGGRQRAGTDVSKLRATSKEPKVMTGSLPRGSERSWGKHPHMEASKAPKNQQIQVSLLCPLLVFLFFCVFVLFWFSWFLCLHLLLVFMVFVSSSSSGSHGFVSLSSSGFHGLCVFVLSRSSGSSRSRSSDSPRLKGKDSPRLRGRESPRSKAKKNRSKATESPRSKGSHSPAAKTNDSPRLKDSPQATTNSSGSSSSSPRTKSSDNMSSPKLNGTTDNDPEVEVVRRRVEAERLLEEAVSSWKEAQEVLQEVKELQSQTLRRQRRRTYEKMTTPASAATGSPTATMATEEDDTPPTPTSPEEEDESETP
uniref:Pleckstrin homology domain containing, family O member 1a n=1 Tax=Sphaeramia orbicularis TaxID=375764 RepID=A0A672ZGE0_9TELE